MTCLELDQALLVSDDSRAPLVEASSRLSRLCGPIIEVVDDTPQFVHFTAKE
jgi:hypothetical protein